MNSFQMLSDVVFPPKSFTATFARWHSTDNVPDTMNCALMTSKVAHISKIFGIAVGFVAFVGFLVLVHVLPFCLSMRAIIVVDM